MPHSWCTTHSSCKKSFFSVTLLYQCMWEGQALASLTLYGTIHWQSASSGGWLRSGTQPLWPGSVESFSGCVVGLVERGESEVRGGVEEGVWGCRGELMEMWWGWWWIWLWMWVLHGATCTVILPVIYVCIVFSHVRIKGGCDSCCVDVRWNE